MNATASAPGTFVYTPPAGTVLPVGAGQTLSVAFTPTDGVNFTTATKSVSIDVIAAAVHFRVVGGERVGGCGRGAAAA